jgi:Mg-chelatase subunit ChlD
MNSNCPKCGANNQAGARFCPQCGDPMAGTVVQGRTVVMQPTLVAGRSRVAVTTPAANGPPPLAVTRPLDDSQQREDTWLVPDVSWSMDMELERGTTKIQGSIRAAINLVLNKARIDPQDRIGIITFTDCAKLLLPLSVIAHHKARIIKILEGLTANGGTDIDCGLCCAEDNFDWSRQGVLRRIILQTDGQDGEPLATAERLKARGVVIDVIGIGPSPSDVNESLLRQVASVVTGQLHYRFIKDSRTLVQHYTQLGGKTQVAR